MTLNQQPKPNQARWDRFGMSTVEFACLLPFFALLSAGLLVLAHLHYRTVCQSYAAFMASRRAVVAHGAGAEGWVRRTYRDCAMPGDPSVGVGLSGREPFFCSVGIRDRFRAPWPEPDGRVDLRWKEGARSRVITAGNGPFLGGDNDSP
jgi:hypothetical protein